MDKKIVKFDDTEIEEYQFHQYKSPISINNIDINKILVSKKFPFGKQVLKYFIGYKNNKEIRPLCIFFPEMSMYKRCSDKTKRIYFMIKGEKKIDKYMTVWEEISNKIKKINNEILYKKKFLKAGKRFDTK